MPAVGSKGNPKNLRELKDDTISARDEKQILLRALSNPTFRNYNVWWSLSESKYAGTALLIKLCLDPKKVFFSLDRTASRHEPDGQVILAEFESFRILNTYVPNNGWKEEENSFQRRRKWDKTVLESILQNSDKPLIWCGDLNVRLHLGRKCSTQTSIAMGVPVSISLKNNGACINNIQAQSTLDFMSSPLDIIFEYWNITIFLLPTSKLFYNFGELHS